MSPRAAALLEHFGFQDVRDYVAGKEDWLERRLPLEGEDAGKRYLGDHAVPDYESFHPDTPVDEVLRRLLGAGAAFGFVLSSGTLLGRVFLDDLEPGSDTPVGEVMELGPTTFRQDSDIKRALDYMQRHDHTHAPMTDPYGVLIGYVTRDAAKRALESES
jgi:CBS domain-containing protein